MSVLPKPACSKKPKTVRCAIYVNSNFDAGGAADLNSIRIQRRALRTYIASHRAKGWICLPEQYEDIGQRGGALRRPAMQQLMADAEAGKLDCVAIHDFHCVTRSSLDRIKLINHFRQCGVTITGVRCLPQHVSNILCDFWDRAHKGSRDECRQFREAQRQRAIRCAVYLRGNRTVSNPHRLDKQRKAIDEFLKSESSN